MGAILLIAQAAAAATGPASAPPDIELNAHVEAREVTVELDGRMRVAIVVEPGTSSIETKRSQPAGARSYRNLTIDARVAGFISQEDDGTRLVSADSSTGELPK